MDIEDRLKRAKKHSFFIGLNDSGAELCRANITYGMAGIHFVQEELGHKPNATFISTPDVTITRSVTRWGSGFGYGGKISWGDGNEPLVVLDVKPNCCGMLVGGLNEIPPVEDMIQRIHDMETGDKEIEGVTAIWDFHKSNHFIDIFEVKQISKPEIDLPKYAFIIHGSADEFIVDNQLGYGLAWERSELLRDIYETIETPFGAFHVLRNEHAEEYYQKHLLYEEITKKKREMAAEMLFGNYTLISNETHQGLVNMNEIVLGAHYLKDDSPLFPLALRADLPAYLVQGKPSLTDDMIEVLGFEKRGKKYDVYDRLQNANILPHGGGYVLPDILTVNRVFVVGGKRYFEVEMLNDRGKKIISEVRDLPYEYRGRQVVLRGLEVGLFDIVAKLIPRYVLKI